MFDRAVFAAYLLSDRKIEDRFHFPGGPTLRKGLKSAYGHVFGDFPVGVVLRKTRRRFRRFRRLQGEDDVPYVRAQKRTVLFEMRHPVRFQPPDSVPQGVLQKIVHGAVKGPQSYGRGFRPSLGAPDHAPFAQYVHGLPAHARVFVLDQRSQ